jgi:chorismate mutase/prephenate dehydratase
VVFRPEREAQVIDGLKTVNPGPLPNDSVAPIWREIMSACRALETPTRVAYLGPAGTFSEEAALGYFGSDRARALRQLRRGLPRHRRGAADFGVCRWKTHRRRVARTLDLFLHTPLFIIGETSLFVRHNLLRKDDSLADMTAVLAHPQALAQCHEWLSPPAQAERRPVSSNAEGARLASLDPRWPPSPARAPGSEFGLHVVAPAIQDDPTTAPASPSSPIRQRHPAPKPSGHDCTSLVVRWPTARRGARHAGAAEEAWRVDDALRVAPGALGPVGVLLLHRHRGPPRRTDAWPRR